MGTYFPGTGTLGWVVWSGGGIAHSRGIPLNFNSPHVNVGLPNHRFSVPLLAFVSPSLVPLWMNVASLNP